MNIPEKELMTMFSSLSKETKFSIISHVRFSVMAENAIKRELSEKHPDLKIEFEPVQLESLKLAVNHG